MKNESIKAALLCPATRLGDCGENACRLAEAAVNAAKEGAAIAVFGELALTGATLGDLYLQRALTDAALSALEKYIDLTADVSILSFVGFPLWWDGAVYDAVAAVSEGELLGISVATNPANRALSRAPHDPITVNVLGEDVTLADTLIYSNAEGVRIYCAVGDGAPVGCAALSSVDLVVNPTASAEYIGAAALRRAGAIRSSRAAGCPVAVCGAGEGESGTDGVYAGARLAVTGGGVVESPLFSTEAFLVDIPLTHGIDIPHEDECDVISATPFVPEDEAERAEACALALEIQSRGLAARLERSYSKTAVLGVSGGLDSTLAVLVAARAMDLLGRGRDKVIAITMPCFGTTARTKSNALALAEELGCTVRTIDIKAAVNQHFKDIGHPDGDYSVVYENSQARERTQILMDVANAEGGLVVGTGDLSELALGFATYNGDHMSMYGVNSSVPKTLMRAIIAHCADNARREGKARLSDVLLDVINTPVSPELLPADGREENAQSTETIVGPYELHDFFLWHMVSYGKTPDEVCELALGAFGDKYTREQIFGYLYVFVKRFFSQQFKRSCMPDGPRVTKISLSPRGGFAMPSDVSARVWRDYFEK